MQTIKELSDQSKIQMKKRKREILKLLNVKDNKEQILMQSREANTINIVFDEFYKEFWSSVVSSGKCPHCQKRNTSIRKEGCSKIFITSITDEQAISKVLLSSKKYNDPNDKDRSSSSDSSSEESSEDKHQLQHQPQHQKKEKKSNKYMNPMEVREHLRLVWKLNPVIFKLLFGTLELTERTLETKKKGNPSIYLSLSNRKYYFPHTKTKFNTNTKISLQ